MHQTDDSNLPPPNVLEALRRARPNHSPCLTDSATEQAARRRLIQQVLAATAVPKGNHKPPAPVLAALYWRAVRRPSPAKQRVAVRRGRRVLSLEPEQLGPDDEVIPPDDPYFHRKKGRPRAVVEAWKDGAIDDRRPVASRPPLRTGHGDPSPAYLAQLVREAYGED